MANIHIFQRQTESKFDWNVRDWITFVDILYNDYTQDNELFKVKNRLNYEFREPDGREIQYILDIISSIYTTNGISNSQIKLLLKQLKIHNLNIVVDGIVNNNITFTLPTRGLVTSDNFFSPPTAFGPNWSLGGVPTPTVSGGTAVFTSGSGIAIWSKWARNLGFFFNCQKYTIRLRGVQMLFAPNVATYGIGMGMMSIIHYDEGKVGIGCYLDCSNEAAQNKLRIGTLTGPGSDIWAMIAESPATMPTTQNDIFNYTLTRNINVVTFTVENITKGVLKSVSYTYNLDLPQGAVMNNRSVPTIWSLGTFGTTTVDSFEITSNEFISPDYVWLGDSILAGYSAQQVSSRITERCAATLPRNHVNLAGAANKAIDYSGNVDEMVAHKPKKAFIVQVGTNNVEHDTLASYQAYIQDIVNTAIGMGSTVILCRLIPRNDGLDVRPFNNDLVARYGPGGSYGRVFKILDYFSVYRTANISGAFDANTALMDDTVHPNSAGMKVLADCTNAGILQFENNIL